jgi:hypothetical protein
MIKIRRLHPSMILPLLKLGLAQIQINDCFFPIWVKTVIWGLLGVKKGSVSQSHSFTEMKLLLFKKISRR